MAIVPPQLASSLDGAVSRLNQTDLNTLFADDPARVGKFSANSEQLHLDFSKNRLDDDAWADLLRLPIELKLTEKIAAMMDGELVNNTEKRAALHTLLRADQETLLARPQGSAILEGRNKAWDLVKQIRNGSLLGSTGKPITTLVNIGIGGSFLGPALVISALKEYCDPGLNYHFVSNIDSHCLSDVLEQVDPEQTLFIVASKSFTTEETGVNATSAKAWLTNRLGTSADSSKHFLAITAKPINAAAEGYSEDYILPIWDWVGGRFSLWSNIGFIVMVALGEAHFDAFLDGARNMDKHFATTSLQQNLPVILALLNYWYSNHWHSQSQGILPYHERLAELPRYLQQLIMESNGKSVTTKGESIDTPTSPVVWGSVGTNGQHSFHQLLHQGSLLIPVDFLLALDSKETLKEHQDKLIANCLGQARALMVGKDLATVKSELKEAGLSNGDIEALAPHKVMPGNRPSNLITFAELTPETLGEILALYEHRTFAESVFWGINAFDQWGVELGKKLSTEIYQSICSESPDNKELDVSTAATLKRIREYRQNN